MLDGFRNLPGLSCFILVLLTGTLYAQKGNTPPPVPSITATITAQNSEDELEDLKQFFVENGMVLTLKKLIYNEQNEITGIHIVLVKDTDRTEFSSHSTLPIPKLSLGFKNGKVFIASSRFALHSNLQHSGPGISWPHMTMDSLLQKHRFAFPFNTPNDQEDFFGMSSLQDMMQQWMSQDADTLFQSFQQFVPPHTQTQKFTFTDTPSISKLIIIDGKESDFDTLNRYATSDQLAAVDVLQPKTAMSIYGAKAKDGVIIATTK